MTRNRSSFQTESADLSVGLEDKSADHDLEVKDAAGAYDEAPADPEPAAPSADVELVKVEMIHHYLDHVPGETVELDAATADQWDSAQIAKKV